MGKHTPGPWLREGNTVYVLMHAGWRKGEELFKNRFSVYVHSDRECPDEEQEANARLIAAAPELLAALVQLEALASRLIGPEATYYELTEARAAIAKATAPIDSTKEAA